MPFNGAGSFTSLGAPTFPAVSGDFILASYFNATMNDVFSGLSSVLPRDGQAAMAANLPMGGFKVTNVGAGAVAGDALMYGQAAAVLAGLTVNTTFAMTGTMTAVAGTVNLTGATSVTVPLQAVSDDSDKAASTAFVQDFFATMPSGTLPSVTGKALYNLRVTAGETGVEWALNTPSIVRDARTSNTILGTADVGKLVDITSGTFSQTFAAAATLGSGWFVWYKNSGTGTVTLDPNGGELINGATTFTLPTLTACLVQCTGTAFTVISAQPSVIRKFPIFSAATSALSAISSTESLENSLQDTGLGAVAITQVIYGNSLFAASANGSNSNIATSADAKTWTLRAMPSAQIWAIGTNGSTGWVAVASGGTATAKSTNGTSWSSGGVLPGTANGGAYPPVFVGTTALIMASTASTVYTTTDNGANWNSQTTPSTIGSAPPKSVGGLFWYWNSGTTAYTSATGATGSWTSRTLPITPTGAYAWTDFDGSLVITNSGNSFYRSTDGINWNLLTTPGTASNTLLTINGVMAQFGTTFGVASSWHNGQRIARSSLAAYSAGQYTVAQNTGATVFCFSKQTNDGRVAYIEPGATDAATAFFSG